MFSCQNSESVRIEKNGFSFTCPEGWKIESEDSSEKNFTMTIQKDGLTSSGTIKIFSINDSIEDMKVLNGLQENFKNTYPYSDLKIDFDSVTTDSFNNLECISSSFEFEWMDDMEHGTRYVFHGKNKTISILIQEAVKHSEINKSGFEAFEVSFVVDQ